MELTFEEWRHTYADVFETDDAARAAWTAASNNGYRAGVQDTRELLAAHNTGAQEPVATLHYDGMLVWKPGMRPTDAFCDEHWSMDLYTHPQPITDAAWCAAYAKLRQPFARPPYEALTSIPLRGAWSDVRERLAYAGRVAETVTRSCEIQLQQRLAEIERLDRAKGE